MDQELSRQEIWEIKRVSRELRHQILIAEGIKQAIGDILKKWGEFRFLGTNPTKLSQVMKKLQNSEQFANTLAGLKDPKTMAQSIESVLIAIKVNNPNIDINQVANILRSELKRDEKDLKKVLEEFEKEKTEVETEEEKKSEEIKKKRETKTGLGGRGLMASVGTTGTTGTSGSTVSEALAGNQNKLLEMITRKIMGKLVVK